MKKLVKGVVYDDVNVALESLLAFAAMETADNLQREGKLDDNLAPVAKRLGEPIEEVKMKFKNLDCIAALTGFNPATRETENMIIPKFCLSESLRNDLASVDIADGMIERYNNHFNEIYLNNQSESEDIEEVETEESVESVPRHCIVGISPSGIPSGIMSPVKELAVQFLNDYLTEFNK